MKTLCQSFLRVPNGLQSTRTFRPLIPSRISEITYSSIRATSAHNSDGSPNRPIILRDVSASRRLWGVLGHRPSYPLRGFLKGYAFLKTMVNRYQNLTGHSHPGCLGTLPPCYPPVKTPQSPRGFGIPLRCLYQYPPEPFRPLFGDPSMIKYLTRLKGGRTKASKRDNPIRTGQSIYQYLGWGG